MSSDIETPLGSRELQKPGFRMNCIKTHINFTKKFCCRKVLVMYSSERHIESKKEPRICYHYFF